MKPTRQPSEKRAIDLIEEATQCLRTAPLATLAVYYLGGIPFVLGLLFFWADMSRDPQASQHLSEGSLGVCLLFLWLKFWQAVFASRIRAQIAMDTPPPLTFSRGTQILVTQTIWQPTGLFLIPLSLIPVIPCVPVYTFYQNATALAAAEPGAAALFKKSCRQARQWPWQNYCALLMLAAFGLAVFISWTSFFLALPQLLKLLFGYHSAFTQSPSSMLNSTFFAAMFGLTYLCTDPIVKIVYALRCFYGESRQSGADLRAELKPWAAAQKMAVGLALALCLFSHPALAQEKSIGTPTPVVSTVPPGDLDQAIRNTIQERKYTWRMPREKIAEDDREGPLGRFFDKIGSMLRRWLRAFLHWLVRMLNKLQPKHHPVSSSSPAGDVDWMVLTNLLLWGLVTAAILALAILLYRVWRGRQKTRAAVTAEAIPAIPDVADENVRADQLPEDEWTRLARELLARGEFRLAMRAFYLASLAHLAARNLIHIARFKSNREYERELMRRGHSLPQVLALFSANISALEQVWYGQHAVDQAAVQQFAQNVDRLKTAG